MVSKGYMRLIIFGSFAVLMVLGYATITNRGEEVAGEAAAISAVMQERELQTALELYHLENGFYPLVEDEAVIDELYSAGTLNSDRVRDSISYKTTGNGQRYTLSVQ